MWCTYQFILEARLSTKTSARLGLYLLLGLNFIYLLQAHEYAVKTETRTTNCWKSWKCINAPCINEKLSRKLSDTNGIPKLRHATEKVTTLSTFCGRRTPLTMIRLVAMQIRNIFDYNACFSRVSGISLSRAHLCPHLIMMKKLKLHFLWSPWCRL